MTMPARAAPNPVPVIRRPPRRSRPLPKARSLRRILRHRPQTAPAPPQEPEPRRPQARAISSGSFRLLLRGTLLSTGNLGSLLAGFGQSDRNRLLRIGDFLAAAT